MNLPSFRELFDRAKNMILLYSKDLTSAMIDTTGTHSNIIAGTIAGIADYLVGKLAEAMQQTFINTATAGYLDELAYGWYGITRKSATPATATVQFSRTNTTGDITIPAGTILLAGDYQFSTDYDLTMDAGISSGLTTATCTIAGYDTNVAANAINTLQTPINDITVTNPNSASGGTDDEDDETFRERVRSYWSIAQRGTLSAIEYGAKQVPGITYAKAIETSSGLCSTVTLYIADQNGQANSTMVSNVTQELLQWKPAGVYVQVIAAVPYMISVAVTISVHAGEDISDAITAVKQAIVAYTNGLSLGEAFVPSDAESYVINNVSSVASCTITDPAVSITPDANSLVRTTLDNITVS